jgi:hypothetical protein
MAFNIEAFIWYLFLLDSIIANLISWFNEKHHKKKFGLVSRYLPLTKAWTGIYLLFILWVGWLYMRLGVLPW